MLSTMRRHFPTREQQLARNIRNHNFVTVIFEWLYHKFIINIIAIIYSKEIIKQLLMQDILRTLISLLFILFRHSL